MNSLFKSDSLSLKFKFLMLTTISLLILFVLNFATIWKMNSLKGALSKDVTLTLVQEFSSVVSTINQAALFLTLNATAGGGMESEIAKEKMITISEYSEKAKKLISNASVFGEADESYRYFKETTDKIVTLLKNENSLEAAELVMKDLTIAFDDLDINISALLASQFARIEESSEDLKTSITKFVTMIGILISIVVTVTFVFSFVLVNSLINPIKQIIEQLAERANSLTHSAEDLKNSSQELSDSSAKQAASVEETSSSLEELTGMVKNNVQSAEHSQTLSEQVQKSASDGDLAMGKLVTSMIEIRGSNENIQELVKVINEIGEKTAVIDEIVFQTKLLSFNASVEAERAGEHGRGFAVVAQEVGNLAQMSGKAALEISEIVKKSIRNAESITTENQKKVEMGAVLVDQTAKVLKSITENAAVVTEKASDIVKASKEQFEGINQINDSVSVLDVGVQGNTKTSDQTAEYSNELTNQALALSDVVTELLTLVMGKNV